MPGPAKISLGQCKRQGDFVLIFYCVNIRHSPPCYHQGEMRLEDAIKRWGSDLRLDQIPARCKCCKSREFVDVRGRQPLREGGSASGKIIEE